MRNRKIRELLEQRQELIDELEQAKVPRERYACISFDVDLAGLNENQKKQKIKETELEWEQCRQQRLKDLPKQIKSLNYQISLLKNHD